MSKYLLIVIFSVINIFPTITNAAAIFSWFPNASVWSLRAAPYIPSLTPPGIIVKGATVIVDPASSTLFSGRITLHYDPTELIIDPYSTSNSYGWLGDWGNNPASLPAPALPLDPNQFVYSSPLDLELQDANSDLISSIDVSNLGSIIIDFDWGSNGFTSDSPYNFFAVNFLFLHDNVALVPVQRGSNAEISMALNSSSPSISDENYAICNPDITNPDSENQFCSTNQAFPSFQLVSIPEPTSLILLSIGLAGISFSRKTKKV